MRRLRLNTQHRDDTAASDDDGAAGSDDEEDDEFLREYRARRMAQMRALSGIPSYGGVKEISKASFVEEVDRTDPRSFVVVHLYETVRSSADGCISLQLTLNV